MFHLDPQQAVLQHVAQPGATPAPSALSDLASIVADQPFERAYSASVTTGIAQVTEAVILIVAGLVVFGVNGGDTLLSALTTLGLVAVAEVLISRLKLHGVPAYRGREQFFRAAFAWTAAFIVLGAIVLLFDRAGALSRSFIAAFWLTGLAVLIVWRGVLHFLVKRWTRAGKFRRRTVIVGGGTDAEALIA
ncbi:MAG: hypothetical protein EON47_22985, partial [Acetobacteraceae bacterium]